MRADKPYSVLGLYGLAAFLVIFAIGGFAWMVPRTTLILMGVFAVGFFMIDVSVAAGLSRRRERPTPVGYWLYWKLEDLWPFEPRERATISSRQSRLPTNGAFIAFATFVLATILSAAYHNLAADMSTQFYLRLLPQEAAQLAERWSDSLRRIRTLRYQPNPAGVLAGLMTGPILGFIFAAALTSASRLGRRPKLSWSDLITPFVVLLFAIAGASVLAGVLVTPLASGLVAAPADLSPTGQERWLTTLCINAGGALAATLGLPALVLWIARRRATLAATTSPANRG